MEDFLAMLITAMIVFLLTAAVVMLLAREMIAWWSKRNQQLEEARKTNQLLTEIRVLLLQGNAVSGIVGNEIMGIQNTIKENGNRSVSAVTKDIYDDLPEL